MSAQEDYREAERRIAEAKASGATDLDLGELRQLELLPPQIAELDELRHLFFGNTRITDITPLEGMTGLWALGLHFTPVEDIGILRTLTGLQSLNLLEAPVKDIRALAGLDNLGVLDLSCTGVEDITPLRGLTELRHLDLSLTQVTDLSPLRDLPFLSALDVRDSRVADLRPIMGLPLDRPGSGPGLQFDGCPAATATAALRELARIEDDEERTERTLAYLRGLPPWPEPWEPERGRDTTASAAPSTVPPIATAQSQIQFILAHAATSQIEAHRIAEQIRFTLKDVPATDGNRLPPVLHSMLDLADVFDRLSRAPIRPDDPSPEDALRRQIAQLEDQVADLVAQLDDSEKAREAAQALAHQTGFWSTYKTSLAKAAGPGTVALASIVGVTAISHFLGSEHPLLGKLSTALETVVGAHPR